MRRLALLILPMILAAGLARAGDTPGRFDYYVLSLSWSADWCALTGDARHDAQCAPGRGFSFVLHGLWPQNETGYPSDCYAATRDPSRGETAAMADIMGGTGLAWHEWQKHGRCSGLTSAAYFAAARRAYGAVKIPPVLAHLDRTLRVKPSVIEDAFLEANPGLSRAAIAVTCDHGLITEARICLTKDLAPRPCSADAAPRCTLPAAEIDAVR
ncbi:MAG: ribonuclease T [Rhodobacteraceae bacterium]|nr:ribonuclease T [Paracoccaceae bacterium]